MDEYLSYLATQTTNRQIFLLSFAPDFHSFRRLFHALRSTWARLGNERDSSGQSHAGLLPFANIMVRHTLVGFQHISSYQSFLAWLTFRPGLEALLMIGKFVDDPANAAIWKNRQANRKSYHECFSGGALESKSFPQSAAFRQILGRLNDDFMHPNPNFAYRDSTQRDQGNTVLLEIHFFDRDLELHEAHILAYLNLLSLILGASEGMVNNLCGPSALAPPREDYSKQQNLRAAKIAAGNDSARKVLEELGLWRF